MKIGVVTYDKRAAAPGWKSDDKLLKDALQARGADALIVSWRNPHIDWQSFDALVLRSCWDSHHHRDEFMGWLRHVEATGPKLINHRAVLEWNYEKERYLTDLLAAFPASPGKGRVTPSHFYCATSPAQTAAPFRSAQGKTLRGILDEIERSDDGQEWLGRDVIVKPTVSGDGDDTLRIIRSERRAGVPNPDALSVDEAEPRIAKLLAEKPGIILQPFVDGIRGGEYSVVYVDGVATHAVHKRTGHGDFKNRSESDRSGLKTSDLPPALRAYADEIWAYVARKFGVGARAYGRIDMVEEAGGRPTLMELELVDPNLQLVRIPETLYADRRYPSEAEILLGEAAMNDVVWRLAGAVIDRIPASGSRSAVAALRHRTVPGRG